MYNGRRQVGQHKSKAQSTSIPQNTNRNTSASTSTSTSVGARQQRRAKDQVHSQAQTSPLAPVTPQTQTQSQTNAQATAQGHKPMQSLRPDRRQQRRNSDGSNGIKMGWKQRWRQQKGAAPTRNADSGLRSCLRTSASDRSITGSNLASIADSKSSRSSGASLQPQATTAASQPTSESKGSSKQTVLHKLTRKLSPRPWVMGNNQDSSTRSGLSSKSSRSGSRRGGRAARVDRSDASNGEPSVSTSSDSSEVSPRRSKSLASTVATPDAPKKSVRFGNVEFRDYHRIVGDNPSCSAGPPIGLGWTYSPARIIPLETYEGTKPERRVQGDLVLSRGEREFILTQWGVSFNDIVDAIRSNIRVKSQRRQTVTNLGKLEKIEEAFETATKMLKRTLLLRRSTGDKVKQLREQADMAAEAFSRLKFVEERTLSQMRSPKRRVEIEPENDDQLEQLDVKVEVSNFVRTSPMDSCVRSPMNTPENDAMSTAGRTMTDKTTPSVREMENFHRELEMEMFGDNEGGEDDAADDGIPPSMVGQTVEVGDFYDLDDDITMAADLQSVRGFARSVADSVGDDKNHNRADSANATGISATEASVGGERHYHAAQDRVGRDQCWGKGRSMPLENLDDFQSLYEDTDDQPTRGSRSGSMHVMPPSFPAHIYRSSEDDEAPNSMAGRSAEYQHQIESSQLWSNAQYAYRDDGPNTNFPAPRDTPQHRPNDSQHPAVGQGMSAREVSADEADVPQQTTEVLYSDTNGSDGRSRTDTANGSDAAKGAGTGTTVHYQDPDVFPVAKPDNKGQQHEEEKTTLYVDKDFGLPQGFPSQPYGGDKMQQHNQYQAHYSHHYQYQYTYDHQQSHNTHGSMSWSENQVDMDAPKIYHIPPPSYLTPGQWMGEEASSGAPHVHSQRSYEPVIIREDGGIEDPAFSHPPTFSPQTVTFPASFY